MPRGRRAQGATSRGRRTQVVVVRGRSQGGTGRFARHPTPSRTFGMRRKPQQSGLQKAIGTLLPMGAAKKAAPSSKKGKAGGAALLAAAAGAGALLRKRQRRTGDMSQAPDASAM